MINHKCISQIGVEVKIEVINEVGLDFITSTEVI